MARAFKSKKLNDRVKLLSDRVVEHKQKSRG